MTSKSDHVCHQTVQIIVRDLGGFAAKAVAALIGCHDKEASMRQSNHVMAPGAPVFRKAMQQDDELSLRSPRLREGDLHIFKAASGQFYLRAGWRRFVHRHR